MMAFGPNGWRPSPNLKQKINRIYNPVNRLTEDPFILGNSTPDDFVPDDERLHIAVIQTDHFYTQGDPYSATYLRGFRSGHQASQMQ